MSHPAPNASATAAVRSPCRFIRPGLSSLLALATLPLALLHSAPASACAACGCTLSKDWLGPQAGSVSGWSLGLAYDYINQNESRTGTRKLSLAQADALLNPPANSGHETEVQTATRATTVQVDYNTDSWGVSVQLPIVDRWHTTWQAGLADPGSYNYNQFTALGDIKVLGSLTVTDDGRFGVVGGLKFASGSTTRAFDGPPGGRIDPALQPGSGSTDLIAGAWYGDMVGNWGWFGQGTLQHAVSAMHGYSPGDALLVNAGLRYGSMIERITPLLQLNYVHRDRDSGDLVNVNYDGSPLTGGNLLYLAPGVSARLGDGFSAYAYLQLPIYQNVAGVQLVARYIASLGVRKNF
ncbi:MAG: hypothetical protein KGI67_06585 [Pseudomonadota bacterium]|nr:hypothetical protein [Pseudomonadota bacterium]